MSNHHQKAKDTSAQSENKESSGLATLFGVVLSGAVLGIGAYLGYQVYKELTKEHLDKIPVSQVRSNEQVEECAICLDKMVYNNKIKVLECNHKYHNECIYQWVTRNSTCPLCRKKC